MSDTKLLPLKCADSGCGMDWDDFNHVPDEGCFSATIAVLRSRRPPSEQAGKLTEDARKVLEKARRFIAEGKVRNDGPIRAVSATVLLEEIDIVLSGGQCGHGYPVGRCANPECLWGKDSTPPSEQEKAREAVVEAAKQKYRSLVYTSGVSREFADHELVKAVEDYLASLSPKESA